MLAAVLTFLSSVFSALPKLVEQAAVWMREGKASSELKAKNSRNDAAVNNALRDPPPPPPAT